MPLSFIRQDITRLHVDAIVNAANEHLQAGGGVCGAIFAAAGRQQLQAACDQIGHVDTGNAVATPAFDLPARHIIHTAGPIWHGGTHGERELLASCYQSSLELADSLGDTSIAFPLISSGIYGYPPAEALAVAVAQIRAFLEQHPDMQVTICLFDRTATTLTQDLYGSIAQYVDDTYVDHSPFRRREYWESVSFSNIPMGSAPSPDMGSAAGAMPPAAAHAAPPSAPRLTGHPQPKEGGRKRPHLPHIPWPFGAKDEEVEESSEHLCGAPSTPAEPPVTSEAAYPAPAAPAQAPHPSDTATLSAMPAAPASQPPLEQLLQHLDAPFSQTLLAMIDERGLTDAQVYNRANLSRQYFSKLRSGAINPSKRVVLSLAVALELPLDETCLLLERAGHALTHASKFDIIIEWFIKAGRYDVFEINEALFAFDQQLLGAS